MSLLKCLELFAGLEEVEAVYGGGFVGETDLCNAETNASVGAGDGDHFALQRDSPVVVGPRLGVEVAFGYCLAISRFCGRDGAVAICCRHRRNLGCG